MRLKLIAIFLFIVVVPLVVLAWLGVVMARDEQERGQQRFQRMASARMADLAKNVDAMMKKHEQDLLRTSEHAFSTPETLREMTRRNRLVRQAFAVGADGKLTYPSASSTLTRSESDFLEKFPEILSTAPEFLKDSGDSKSTGRGWRWHTWFKGGGVQFVFWIRTSKGTIAGFDLEGMAILADVISALPSMDAAEDQTGRIVLTDSMNKPVYQAGDYQPASGARPAVKMPLLAPLGMWSLEYYPAPGELPVGIARSAMFNVLTAVATVMVAILLSAAYFYRESTREIREAGQKVTFVNQVSHELKTPLTNIRMYAELLGERVPDDDPKSHEYANVIVSESKRLGRVINNVLSMASESRGQRVLRTRESIADDVIGSVLETYAPMLKSAGVETVFTRGAGEPVLLDRDVLEQILGNLISNVEKYALSGKHLGIVSRHESGRTVITVSDKGPGIPRDKREDVFKPFVRLSNRLTDGVSGTGIGLTIARELARLHGGGLRLVDSVDGATFVLELNTPDTGKPA